MSSLHHLPRDQIRSNVLNERMDENLSPIEDNIESNGKAFGKVFESIHIFGDGSVVIASDNLQGLVLNGFVTKYERIDDVPLLPVLSLTPDFGGICNLIGMRDKRLICGFDSGHISLLSPDLEEQVAVISHDSLVCRLSCDRLETKTVSCGHDLAILVLDLRTFMPYQCYNYAHSAIIWDIEFSQTDDNRLLSCSRDRNVLLWDLRKPKPASCVATLNSEPTALCWSAKDLSYAYVGTECGQLVFFDVRVPGQEVSVCNSSSHRIHRIKTVFNGNGIAVCADDPVFKVFSDQLLDCIYEDKSSHSDWVQAVCQHNQQLYTVGRDTRLVRHSELNIQ